MIPETQRDVIALIHNTWDLGRVVWYEVVYHDGEKWCAYSGSNTFKNGEVVIQWTYCVDVHYENVIRKDLL